MRTLAVLILVLSGCSEGGRDESGLASTTSSSRDEPVEDGRYQLIDLMIDGEDVTSWSVGQEQVAELTIAGTSWRFEACNRFETIVAAESGTVTVRPGPITAAACGDDWLLSMADLRTYSVEGDVLILDGTSVSSSWKLIT